MTSETSRRISAAVMIIIMVVCAIIAALHPPHSIYSDLVTPTTRITAHVDSITERCTAGVCEPTYHVSAQGKTLDVQGYPYYEVKPGDTVILTQDSSGKITFSDVRRSTPLIVWVFLAYLALIIVGGLTGLYALIGLGSIIVVLLAYVVPLVGSGESFLLPSICALLFVMGVSLLLSHGVKYKTVAAYLGTTASFLVSIALTWAGITTLHLSPQVMMGEDTLMLGSMGVNIKNLILLSTGLGILGGLNDMTITQSSAVATMTGLDARTMFSRAMVIGKDHMASSVYTLFLSYLASSIPYYIAISASGLRWDEVAVSTVVASEILRAVVTVLSLCLCVPVTTMIAIVTKSDTVEPGCGHAH